MAGAGAEGETLGASSGGEGVRVSFAGAGAGAETLRENPRGH